MDNVIYGYCRATTSKQIEEGFLEEQRLKIKERYFESEVFIEETIEFDVKPEFDKLLEKTESGDTIVVTKMDRFAKSIDDALNTIKGLRERGVWVHILNIGLIDDSILGGVLYDAISAFEEFEKALIVEKVQSGKVKAKKVSGFKEGRPKKYTDEEIEEALDLLKEFSYKKVEALTGISKSTLIRAKKQRELQK